MKAWETGRQAVHKIDVLGLSESMQTCEHVNMHRLTWAVEGGTGLGEVGATGCKHEGKHKHCSQLANWLSESLRNWNASSTQRWVGVAMSEHANLCAHSRFPTYVGGGGGD